MIRPPHAPHTLLHYKNSTRSCSATTHCDVATVKRLSMPCIQDDRKRYSSLYTFPPCFCNGSDRFRDRTTKNGDDASQLLSHFQACYALCFANVGASAYQAQCIL